MHRSILQTLALVPLLLVVLLVVWAGRRPVPPSAPPLKRAGANAAAAPATGAVTLPPAPAPGWQLQGTPVRYDEKTLFDRIDGAAPAYLRAGFVYSLGAEYRKQGAKDPIIVDVYDLGTERQALGIYATERDKSYRFVELGEEGYLASGSSNFWRGRFYVKLAGYEQGEGMDRDLLELGRGLAAALPLAKDKDPALSSLGLLPPDKVDHTDGYSHPPLGDIDGLSQVFYADYPRPGDQTYRLFAVRDESAAAAAGRLARVKTYFEKDRAKIDESSEGQVHLLVATGESGASLVLVSAEIVAGGIDLPDAAVVRQARAALLQSLSKKIPPPGTALTAVPPSGVNPLGPPPASGPAKEKP